MKKEYAKPILAIESFQLDAAIAGSCDGKMVLSHSVSTCTLVDDGGIDYGHIYFGDACEINLLEKDVCYQAMSYSEAYLQS